MSLLFLGSCESKQDIMEELDKNTQIVDVNLSVKAPEEELQQMRSALLGDSSNSSLGGIINVDLKTQYDLRYQIAIYKINTDGSVTQVIAPILKVEDTAKTVNFNLRLTLNHSYKAVLWVDFVPQGKEADYHYNTQHFPNISFSQPNNREILNDESRDAYYAVQEFTVGTKGIVEQIVLKRPFAKLRIVTTDWNSSTPNVDRVAITYYGCKRFTGINLLTEEGESIDLPENAGETYKGSLSKTQKEYAQGYDLSANNRTLAIEYLMIPNQGQIPIRLTFESFEGDTSIAKHILTGNIPIQRNWLTTITGNLLSKNKRKALYEYSLQEVFPNALQE